MDISYDISDKCCFITPGKFLFGAGKTPKEWNDKILSNPHVKVCRFERDSEKIFHETDVKGGLAITFMDQAANYGAIGKYEPYEQLKSVVQKVKSNTFSSIASLIFAPESYKFTEKLHQDYPDAKSKMSNGHFYDVTTNIFKRLPFLFYAERPQDGDEYIRLYGLQNKNRKYLWIKKCYIRNHENLLSYKIFVPKVNGSGALGEELSDPIIGEPNVGHTQTFISIGSFDNRKMAENALKYIKTKFVRALLGTLKTTPDNKKRTWLNVPLQDFAEHSDIDWSKSIPEIDQQLYRKYNLSEEEIAFIEKMIKPME